MVFEGIGGPNDEVHQTLGILSFREIIIDDLADDVVRSGRLGSFAVWKHHDISIGDTRIPAGFRDLLFESLEKLRSLSARDMAGRKILHLPVLDRDQIAPVGEFPLSERDPHAERLERSPSGVIFQRIVAEDRHVRNIRTRGERVVHGLEHAASAFTGDPVHIGFVCRFERGLSPKLFKRLVSRTVSQNKNIFHGNLTYISGRYLNKLLGCDTQSTNAN